MKYEDVKIFETYERLDKEPSKNRIYNLCHIISKDDDTKLLTTDDLDKIYASDLTDDYKKHNHNNTIESYEYDIDIITSNGFDLYGVSQMYLESVYIFKTSEEADKAHRELRGVVDGWFYGLDNIDEGIDDYIWFMRDTHEDRTYGKDYVLIHWLKNPEKV